MIGLSTGTAINAPAALASPGESLALIHGTDVIAADTVIL